MPLLDSFYSRFASTVIVPKGTTVARYVLPWNGQTVLAVTSQDTSLFAWAGSKPSVKVEVTKLQAPQAINTQVGTLTARSAYQTVTTPVVLLTAATTPDWQWRVYKR